MLVCEAVAVNITRFAHAHRVVVCTNNTTRYYADDGMPDTGQLKAIRDGFTAEAIHDYFDEVSYGHADIEFSYIEPVAIRGIKSKYTFDKADATSMFNGGSYKLSNGVIVRPNGCVYAAPNIFSGSKDQLAPGAILDAMPTLDMTQFHGAAFVVFTSECSDAAVTNAFYTNVDGKVEHFGNSIVQGHAGSRAIEPIMPRAPGDAGADKSFWDNYKNPLEGTSGAYVHELIHAVGIGWHSSAYMCDATTSDFRTCETDSYGNEFSRVGGTMAATGLPAHELYQLHYLSASDIQVIDKAGVYRIAPLNHAIASRQHRAAVLPVTASQISNHNNGGGFCFRIR